MFAAYIISTLLAVVSNAFSATGLAAVWLLFAVGSLIFQLELSPQLGFDLGK